MNGVLGRGLGGGLAFGQWGNHEGFMKPTVVPSAGIGDLAITLLPQLRLLPGADQGKCGTIHHWNVGAAGDFKQPQSVLHFFVAPLIAAGDGYAENFNLRRLNQQQHRLHVAAARSRAVFVEDNFPARLGVS